MKTRRAALALLLPAVFVPSCQNTGRVTDDTALDGPMMGAADETSFTIGGDGPVKLTDLVIIAKEIRKYRALNASEQEIIRRVVSLKLDGVAVKQMEQLKPRFEAKKKVVREQTQKRIADVKRRVRATTPAKSDAEIEKAPEVVQATRQIQVEEQQEITKIDDDLRQQARAAAAKSLGGTDFAVRVNTDDGKAVVAFASFRQTGVQVASNAYEVVGLSGGQLAAATNEGKVLAAEGRQNRLIAQIDLPAKN